MSEENVLYALEKSYGMLSPAQQKVADYILKDPVHASYLTIEQLSQASDVSTATIVRTANALGYSGFAEFQSAVRQSVQSEMRPSKRLETSGAHASRENELESAIMDSLFTTFHETTRDINTEDLRTLVEKISLAENVYVVGSRSCYSVAHYLSYNINRILGNCRFLNPSDCCFAEEINRIKQGDVFISYTLPRYIKDVVVATEYAHKIGAFTAVMTDSYRSPSAEFGDIIIRVPYKSFDFHNTVMPGMIVAEIVISSLTASMQGAARNNLSRMEETLSRLDVHMN